MPNVNAQQQTIHKIKKRIERAKKLTTSTAMDFVAACGLALATIRMGTNSTITTAIFLQTMPWIVHQINTFGRAYKRLDACLQKLNELNTDVHPHIFINQTQDVLSRTADIVDALDSLATYIDMVHMAAIGSAITFAWSSQNNLTSSGIRSLPARK